MGSEDQERGRRHNEEPEVEAHQHVGGRRLNEEATQPEDKGDDTPDVEAHQHVGGRRLNEEAKQPEDKDDDTADT